MDIKIELRVIHSAGGIIGVEDKLNPNYNVLARRSIWATNGQNNKLEKELFEVYKNYLEEVAQNNINKY